MAASLIKEDKYMKEYNTPEITVLSLDCDIITESYPMGDTPMADFSW